MTAPAVATIAAPAKISPGKNHQSVHVQIKIVRQTCLAAGMFLFLTMKGRDAVAADAAFVAGFRWNLREQGVGHFQFGAPARTFPCGVGAELTFVRLSTQRAPRRVQ